MEVSSFVDRKLWLNQAGFTSIFGEQQNIQCLGLFLSLSSIHESKKEQSPPKKLVEDPPERRNKLKDIMKISKLDKQNSLK